MQFDDRPVGGGTGPNGPSGLSPEEDFRKVPIEKLLIHSNWKARKVGFEKLLRSPSKSKAAFFESIAKSSSEGNAAAQEALFEALVALIPFCTTEELTVLSAGPLSLAIEKGITGRPKAVQSAQEFASLLVENGKHSEVFEILLPALSHKTPKNRMAAAQLCGILVQDFGVQSLPLKLILKAMQPLFNDANPQVRKEAFVLCNQCYMYMGASIKGFLSDLREVQLQELEKQFEQVCVGEIPPKSIKGVRPTTTKTAVSVSSLTTVRSAETDADDSTLELLDESPVLSKLPRNFFQVALDKEVSWQDRCSFVNDTLLPLLAVPRLRSKDDYHELASMMRVYLLDPQAPLMLLGIKMIQDCARGLRADFAVYARGYLNPLFEKMKDRKTSVLEHVMLTLEKLIRYHCITFDQCSDEMEQGSQSKNPSQRKALMNFCIRMIDQLDKSEYVKFSNSTSMLKRMVSDEKTENRDTAYVLLDRLLHSFDESLFRPILSVMDDKQKARMQVVISSSARSALPPTSSKGLSTPSSSPAKKIPRVEGSAIHTAIGAISAHVPLSSDAITNTSLGSTRSSAHPNRPPALSEDPISLESTLSPKMEAINIMLGLFNGDTTILDLLRSSDWSQRHDGLLRVRAVTGAWSPAECTRRFSTLVVFLRNCPGWKESTFQVFQLVLSTIGDALSKIAVIRPGAGYAIVAGVTPRLTEAKHKQTIKDMCSRVAQLLSLRFVIGQMIIVAAQIRTPKLLQECNEYFIELVEELKSNGDTLETLDVKAMFEYLKKPCFEMTAPPLRHSSMQLLLALSQVADGAVIERLVTSLPPQIVAMYEHETLCSGRQTSSLPHSCAASLKVQSKRVRAHSQSPSTRSANCTSLTSTGRGGSAGRGHSTGATDTLTPRTTGASGPIDIPSSIKLIVREIVNGLDWRDRLEGVHKVEELIQKNDGTLAPATVGPLLKALSSRFDEANKNFVVDVLRTIILVVNAGGHTESRAGLRKLLPGACAMLGDQKTTQREEARKVVFLGIDVCGLDSLLACFQKPLSSDSNVTRQNTLEAMLYAFESRPADVPISRAGLQLLIPGVVKALMDRILEVRIAAEQVIGHFLPITGDEPIYRCIQQLKPADQHSVMPAIERQLQLYTPSAHRSFVDSTINEDEEPLPTSTSQPTAGLSRVTTPPRIGRHLPVASTRTADSSAGGTANGAEDYKAVPSQFEKVTLKTVSVTKPSITKARASNDNEEVYTTQEIMLGLRSASPEVAYTMCSDFMRYFRQGHDCGTPEMMQIMVERLYENTTKLEPELAIGLVGCLSAMFMSPRSAQRCHSSLLFRLLGSIFDCLLSEQFSLNEPVVKSLNNMTLKLLEGCTANDVFSALLSRMTSYSSMYVPNGGRAALKYIQVTVKCIMRLDLENVAPDNVVLCCHEYLLQHPPSAFRQLDDLPIRTVKTILQTATKRYGSDLLATADRLVGPQNLVTHFIRACLDNRERTQRRDDNEVQAVEEIKQQKRASQSPIPSTTRSAGAGVTPFRVVSDRSHVDPTAENSFQSMEKAKSANGGFSSKVAAEATVAPIVGNGGINPLAEEKATMSALFSCIRNHLTSAEGIDELYAYLKVTPPRSYEADFSHQLQRCSQAFRQYIKRKLERKRADDKMAPPQFQLPAILSSLS